MIIVWLPNVENKPYHDIDESFLWTGTYTKPPIILNYLYHATLEAKRKYKATLEAGH